MVLAVILLPESGGGSFDLTGSEAISAVISGLLSVTHWMSFQEASFNGDIIILHT